MDIGVGDGPKAEDFSPTDLPLVTIDSFESDNQAADGIIQTFVDDVTSVGNRQENIPSSTDADGIPPSRPLVHRIATGRERKDEPDELMSFLKAQINQYAIRQDQEHQIREQERKDREEERRDQRERRAAEARRHESSMEMMMMMMMIFKRKVKINPESE